MVLVRVVSINFCKSPPIHGIDGIPATTASEVSREEIKELHLPNQELVNGSSTPKFSANSSDSEVSPAKALVMLPSGEVLFGVKVQQKVPNILHTPPISASNISRAILFCHAVREVGPSCSAIPLTASLV